jgi:gamma-glutamylcyclotransferase (GGCT)/AIG2-like uncharacterized protein YtfP
VSQLFVYGTLKRGECRAHLLEGQRCLFPECRTAADYLMVQLEGYPGLIEVAPGAGKNIVGELWQIDNACRARLDIVEDVAEGLYQLRSIRLEGRQDGQAYFYLRSVSGLPVCGCCWSTCPRS